MLDIKPFHIDMLNCYEGQVATAVSWLGRDYTLMFSEIWCFSFKEVQEEQPVTLGERISVSSYNKWKLLEKYHGVKVTGHDTKDADYVLPIVKKEVAENRPVLIPMDSYWCPWHEYYQKGHEKFYFLAVGVDEEGQNLLCTDSFHMHDGIKFPIEEYRKAQTPCATFALLDSCQSGFDWKDLIRNATSRLKGEAEYPNAFDAIRRFAREIESYFNTDVEVGSIENYWETPLFKKLIDVGKSRLKFAAVLKYLIESYHADGLQPYIDDLETAASKWAMIREMVAKGIAASYMPRMQGRISAQLLKVADFEEEICNRMQIEYKG